MTTDLTVTEKTLERLNRTTEKDSLDDLIKSRTRRSLLLLDCSGSMSLSLSTGETRIEALRKVHTELMTTHRVPTGAFGPYGRHTRLVEVIPEPGGCTPMASAIDFAREQGANHLVIVTDGEPDSATDAFAAAARFSGTIDVFFIGDEGTRGAQFAADLAKRAGGTSGVTDLTGEGSRKKLTGKITLLLGDGKDVL